MTYTKPLKAFGDAVEKVQDHATDVWLAAVEAAGTDPEEHAAAIESINKKFAVLKELVAQAEELLGKVH